MAHPARLSRRTLLKSSAVLAGAATAGTLGAGFAAAAPSVPVTEERRRAVVVGTGFGGAITALRLGRAGVPTLLLERGIRWPIRPDHNTFPTLFSPDRRSSWLTSSPVFTGSAPALYKPFTGVVDRFRGNGMDILAGSGVGGGSLVYHGMTIQPRGDHFSTSMPAGLDYEQFDRDFYRRALAVLRPAPIPDDVLASPNYRSSRVFFDRAQQAGLAPYRVPLPLDWEVVRKELRGELPPSYSTGDVITGANNGHKNTVDITYVAAAEATGKVELAVLHRVNDIQRDPSGRWVLLVDRIDTDGAVQERKKITTDALFLAGGSAGTSKLLVKAKAKNLVPDLPDAVGANWGNNGDRIFSWTPLDTALGAKQGGPACAAVRDWDHPDGPMTIISAGVPFPVDLNTTSVIAVSIVEPRGYFRYDAAKDDAVLQWSQSYDAAQTTSATARIRRIVGGDKLLQGIANPTIDTTTVETTTYHPLGGATIGTVCDLFGRVQGQRGLYVNDGALIPGSTGAVNPSLTIAALAEHNMDDIISKDVGNVF